MQTRMTAQEIVALDLGKKRTGMARASTMARLPEPMQTVPTGEVIDTLARVADTGQLSAIVVGLPRNLSGDDTKQTEWTRHWVQQAKRRLGVPMFWQDEALSSRINEPTDKSSRADVDSLAAAVILQDFLDTPASERVVC